MRCVVLDGKTYRMRDVLKTYKEQRHEERRAKQLTLFELREDTRPKSQQTVKGRYEAPMLFE